MWPPRRPSPHSPQKLAVPLRARTTRCLDEDLEVLLDWLVFVGEPRFVPAELWQDIQVASS
jgi:hypothetical protein